MPRPNVLRRVFLLLLLVLLEGGFRSVASAFATNKRKGRKMSLGMKPVDDDDISQHVLFGANNNNNNATGYRAIEEWHKETSNPKQVLEQLKREQARWKAKFEDLGGDGI